MSKEIVDPTISAQKNEVSTTLTVQEIFQLYQFEYIQTIMKSQEYGLHLPILLRVGIQAPSVLIAGDDKFVASVLPAVRFSKLQNPGNITVVTDGVSKTLWGALHNPSYHSVTVNTSMNSVYGKQGIVIVQNNWSGIKTVQGVTRATHYLVVLGQQANRDPSKPEKDDWDAVTSDADWVTGWSSTVNNGISVQSPDQRMAARMKELPDLHPSEKNATGEFINGAANKYRRLQELERDLRKQGAMPGIH